jgi:capsular polysaccharide biosynthesis protein
MHISDKQPDLPLPISSGVPALQPRPILPPDKSEIDVLDSLQRRWLLAAGIFIICTAVGYRLIRHFVKPAYQAETTVYVSPSALKDNLDHVNEVSYATLINHQILTVVHYDTLSAALRRLDAAGHHWKRPGETEQAAIERLRYMISVWRVPDSYEITIGARGSTPTDLAAIANAVAQAYLAKGSGEFISERSGRLAVLTRENAFVEKKLNEKLDDVAQYSEKLQVVDLQRASTFPDDAVLAQMRMAVLAAHQKRIEAEQQMEVDEKSNAAAEAEQIVMNDAAARSMMDGLLQKQSDLRLRLDGMLPANPLYRTAERGLSSIDSQLHSVPTEMVRTIGAQLMDKRRTDVDQSQRIERALSDEFTVRLRDMESASRELRQARALNEDIERLRTHLRDVQARIDSLNLQAEMPGFLSVFSVAQRPLQPLKNQKQKAWGALLALALALSLSIPVILDAADPRVHNPASVERILGLLPVGMTIESKPGREDFADEHLRRLTSGIQRCIARGAKTVLLTPLKFGVFDALASEIARDLTERGFRPVLVHATRQMLIPNAVERIAGRAQISALGPYASMLKAAEQDCDVVLVSAPPLLLSSDAELLATEADVTLIIAQAGKTTRKDLERAGRLLERLHVAGVGAILTNVRIERAGRLLRNELRDHKILRTASAGAET